MQPCEVCGVVWAGNGGTCSRCVETLVARRRRRTVLVPALAFAVAAAVVVPVVLALARSWIQPATAIGAAGVAGSPVRAAAPADRCLVGNWTETAHEERLRLFGFADPTLTGAGATLELDADGSGTVRIPNGTTYTTTVLGQTVAVAPSGLVSITYRVAAGALQVPDQYPDGTTKVLVDGSTAKTGRLSWGAARGSRYTCSAQRLELRGDGYDLRFVRAGRAA